MPKVLELFVRYIKIQTYFMIIGDVIRTGRWALPTFSKNVRRSTLSTR